VVIEVRDDGVGGAAFSAGGGLDGVRRRLAAFDGTVKVDSPEGGPTIVTMTIPAAAVDLGDNHNAARPSPG